MENETRAASFVPLTPSERSDLLWLARASIRAMLLQADQPTIAVITAALRAPGAAFVSLHRHTQLRGCVGTLAADDPLYLTVARMARSAAVDDPRFPALTLDELIELAIEISRLSALVPARPDQVCPGRHGVLLSLDEHRSVYLPQVATQYSWDRDTLLNELCLKAMLPKDAWKDPAAELCVFEAEVFGDETAQR